ncbi:hypothetical protein I302_103095 [Kwoniella bestiolae CBS 10118]|uniref:Glycosyltransferase family 1 protein n=1 Tax=Kwoniella bestiolae CBS 10118 TaxID=1296100 RepID=A0A1B9GGZ7_9TREE|nr:hypothetical protein I302_01795 [Kwoniella bestiolae CBS 10118]OCF30276.1 hypothetical protein I302_01795 [Kwoniella bestiolae CBS 10118]
MSRPRSRFMPTRRSLPFILLSTIFVLYKSIPSDLSSRAPNLSSYLSAEEVFYPQYDSPISTRSAGDHGTFVETSAYDLPKLIKSKSNKKSLMRQRSKRGEVPGEDVDGLVEGEEEEEGEEGSIKDLRIAVLEHAGFHEEVVGAVLKTLTDIGANFTLYRDKFRWGYAEVLSSGMNYTTPPTHYSDGTFAQAVANDEIDVTIHISCDHEFWNWPRNTPAYDAMKNNKNMEVVCMLHELENLSEKERNSWEIAAKEERLTYLTLSKHVKTYLKNEVLKWSHSLKQLHWGKVDVEEFVPIFPVDASKLPDSEDVSVSEFFPKRAERVPSRLAILGNIQPWRRTYNPILSDLHAAIEADPAAWGYQPLSTEPNSTYMSANDDARPPVTLHFIGSLAPTAELNIPDSMRDMVFIHSGLEYISFYRLLGSMDLVLPAFMGWTYLEKKLSSAIPAGIVSRVPVLGSELLLNAYQFLRDPSIVLHAPGLREIEAILLLRKGIDPYTNQPKSHHHSSLIGGDSNTKPLLPGKIAYNVQTGQKKQLPLGMKKLNDDIPTKSIGSSSHEDWEEYHQRLYGANAEMMVELLEGLSRRIQGRRERSRVVETVEVKVEVEGEGEQ